MQIDVINSSKKRSLYLIKLSIAMMAAVLMSGLAACGGGGSGTPGNASTATTITSISPVGIVAANPQPLFIHGTNFESGMALSVTDKNGASHAVNSIVVSPPADITATVALANTTPPGGYVNLSVQTPNGIPLATAVLGVASKSRTLLADVQAIFDAKCGTCHVGSAATAYLDLSSFSASASNLISNPSTLCSPRFRVIPGDPRRTSSVLIDKILAASSGSAACSGSPMPPLGSPQLSPAEIQTIIDWVALGAN